MPVCFSARHSLMKLRELLSADSKARCIGLFFVASLIALTARGAFAQVIREGDYVATVVDTPVKANSDALVDLPAGTNFRVANVQSDWLNYQQSFEGKKVNGWVRARDVIALPSRLDATEASKDDVGRDSMQYYSFKTSGVVQVVYEATAAVDVYLVDESNFAKLKEFLKTRDQLSFSTKASRLAKNHGLIEWAGEKGRYHLVIDNTKYPANGANANRDIEVKVAFCKNSPKPEGMRSTRGMLLGRVLLRFDGYRGRQESVSGPMTVEIDCIDGEEIEPFTVVTNEDGYFFAENVKVNREYRLKRFTAGTAQTTFGMMTSLFRKQDNTDKWIDDLGVYTAVVREKGVVDRFITSEGASVTAKADDEGKTSLSLGTPPDLPLDRHDWFLEAFPKSDWIDRVLASRDRIYKKRAEAAKKKEQKEKEKAGGEKEKGKEKSPDKSAPASGEDDGSTPTDRKPAPELPVRKKDGLAVSSAG